MLESRLANPKVPKRRVRSSPSDSVDAVRVSRSTVELPACGVTQGRASSWAVRKNMRATRNPRVALQVASLGWCYCTLICFGFWAAVSVLGMCTVRIPSLLSQRMASAFTLSGSEKLRSKLP
jgi:hypothetical protein